MELLVKIGADQQNLQQTIQRMQQQFKTMNMSVPVGWDSASGGASWNRAAKSANPADNAFAAGMIGRLSGFSAAAGGWAGVAMALHRQLEKLVDWASQKMGAEFWNRVFGVDPATVARVAEAHQKLIRGIKDARAAETQDEADAKKRVFENQTDQGKLQSLGLQLADAKKSAATAEAEMLSRRTHAKEAKGLLGAELSAEQWMKVYAEYTEAKTNYHKERMNLRSLEDQYKRLLNQLTAQGVQEVTAAREATAKQTAKELIESPRASFEADSLARVGLFAGSALNMNPDFSVQTELLKQIERNTSRSADGFL